jgi:glutaredoxin-like protein
MQCVFIFGIIPYTYLASRKEGGRMALLNTDIKTQLEGMFAELSAPVKLVVFTQGEGGAIECSMCTETRQLVEEVAELSDKLEVQVFDFVRDENLAKEYQVDKIPAVVVLANGDKEKDYGVRLYGIPSGYEFGSLIEDILLVSSGNHNLSKQTLRELEKLDRPVHIQVYVTPT